MKISSLVVVLVVFCFDLSGQHNSVPSTFRSPLDVPLYLSGNFGELRSGHFHAGLDIKTQQREGLNVYAVEQGFVSRIKISLGGYGKCLYITHPNGYTTVYAHLRNFAPEIEAYVRKEQYRRQSFEIEIFPSQGELDIDKGEVVAQSGNTGGSGGPHLHFEVRKTSTGTPMNPLLFDFDIKDTRQPILKELGIYPLNDTSTINGSFEPLFIPLKASGNNFYPDQKSLQARGVIGFGIEVVDYLNGSANKCGAYEIALSADGASVYKHTMDEIPFPESRYIHSHVDYHRWKRYKHKTQKSFIDPGNKLSIYSDTPIQGKVFFSSFGHDLTYRVVDVHGNESKLNFSVALDTNHYHRIEKNDVVWTYNSPLQIDSSFASVYAREGSNYRDLPIQFGRRDTLSGAVCPTIDIMDLYTPLHYYMEVKIKVDTAISKSLYAVSLKDNDDVLSPEGGSLRGDEYVFKTRSFGPYTVLVDTVAPSIQRLNSESDTLLFKVKDEESGVTQYDAYINGDWALMEFDSKEDLMWIAFDSTRFARGPQSLRLVIKDHSGNQSVEELTFSW